LFTALALFAGTITELFFAVLLGKHLRGAPILLSQNNEGEIGRNDDHRASKYPRKKLIHYRKIRGTLEWSIHLPVATT
jgi:hypothetical protein